MAPVHSKPLSYEATRRTLAAVHEKIWPAALKVYGKKPPPTTKGSGDSTGDKEDAVRFSCPLIPNASKADLKDKSNNLNRYVNQLGTGCTAEEYIKYRKDVEEVASLLMKSGEGQDEKCKKCVNIATATLHEELKEAFSLEHVRCQELNERMVVSIRKKHKADALQHKADQLGPYSCNGLPMGATGPIGSDRNIVYMESLADWALTLLTVAPRQLGPQGRTRV
jgi:hypothetical protein